MKRASYRSRGGEVKSKEAANRVENNLRAERQRFSVYSRSSGAHEACSPTTGHEPGAEEDQRDRERQHAEER
jgi:hypothetical protein